MAKSQPKRTHCFRGHDFATSPTRVYKDGSRACLLCIRLTQTKYYKEHKEEINALNKAYNEINKLTQEDYRLKYEYGITREERDDLIKNQNELCKICGKQNKNNKKLNVDHKHGTKIIRGMLCSNCNRGLGMFFDCPSFLVKAAKYLHKFDLRFKDGAGI